MRKLIVGRKYKLPKSMIPYAKKAMLCKYKGFIANGDNPFIKAHWFVVSEKEGWEVGFFNDSRQLEELGFDV